MSMHGQWYWHELATPDPEGAKAFYKAVAGWETRPMLGMPDYTLWVRAGDDHGGVMKIEGPMWDGIPPHWMLYIAIDDVDAARAAVEANGGVVAHGPFEAGGVGTIMVCKDPAGAVFSLIKPAG